MPRNKRLVLALAVLALVCLAPAAARADTIAIVINGGTYEVTGGLGISFASGLTNGTNFTAGASGDSNEPACWWGCAPGKPVSPSFHASGFQSASLVYNGVSYSYSPLGGQTVGLLFDFGGPGVIVDPNNPATWQTTFTMTGLANVNDPNSGPLTFSLTGSGIVTFDFIIGPDGWLNMRRAVYEFQPQPTPEPATLGLLLLGAAGVAARETRRRRSAGRSSNP